MTRLLIAVALTVACVRPSVAQPLEVVKELERLDKLIGDEMDKLKPAVEARYDIVDWRQLKEAALKVPLPKGGKGGTLILADDLTLNKVEYRSLDSSCPPHFAILADTIRVKDLCSITLNAPAELLAGRGGSCVLSARQVVWASDALVSFNAQGNQRNGSFVLETSGAEAVDFRGKPLATWEVTERKIDDDMTAFLGTAKLQQTAWGSASANLVAQAKACQRPPLKLPPKGPKGPVVIAGTPEEVGEWQALNVLKLSNTRLKRSLSLFDDSERIQALAAYRNAVKDADDALRKEINKGLNVVAKAVIRLVTTEVVTVTTEGRERQATVVRELLKPGMYWIMPTDVLFLKDTQLGGKKYLGFGVIESELPNPLTLVSVANLTVDPWVVFEVQKKIKGERYSGPFHNWRLTSRKDGNLKIAANSQDDGASLLVELTVTQDSPAESISFQRMLKPEGLPVSFNWQALADPNARGELKLGLSFARRIDAGIRVRQEVQIDGKPCIPFLIDKDFGYSVLYRYSSQLGQYGQPSSRKPFEMKPDQVINMPKEWKLHIPSEAVDLQIDDSAKVINEFRLKVAGDLVSRVKVKNLAAGELKGFGPLSHVEVSMRIEYETQAGKSETQEVPKFVLAAAPAEGSEYRRPYILPDGAKDVRFVGKAVAICADGRRELPFDTTDAVISITNEALEKGRMK